MIYVETPSSWLEENGKTCITLERKELAALDPCLRSPILLIMCHLRSFGKMRFRFFLITFQWRWCAVPYMSAQATGILRALPTAASLLFSPWTVVWRCDLHWSVVVSNGPCLLQIPLPCQHSAHFPEYYISRLISFHYLSIDWDGDKFWTDMLFLSWFRIMRVLDINVYHMFYKR